MARILTLTEFATCQRAQETGSFFVDPEHWKNVVLEKVFLIFKSNLSPEHVVTEKWTVGTVYLIFHVVSKNEVGFDATPWESAAFTSLFSKVKVEHFKNRFFCLQGKTMRYDSYSTYLRVLPWRNAKSQEGANV